MDVQKSLFTLTLLSAYVFSAKQAIAQEQSAHIERIEVVGELTVSGYKNRLEKVQKDFFELYNQATEDTMLKILCRKEIKPGTGRIRIEVCTPAYESKLSPRYMSIAGTIQEVPDPIRQKRTKDYKAKHLTHMTMLVNTNKELRDKFTDFVELTKKLNDKQMD